MYMDWSLVRMSLVTQGYDYIYLNYSNRFGKQNAARSSISNYTPTVLQSQKKDGIRETVS